MTTPFVQIIECETTKVDQILALDREWEAATEGKRTLRRSMVLRDRNKPNRYLVLAFFDSYEAAQENSKLPETDAFATRYSALVDGPIEFYDMDVVDDRS